MALPNPAVRVVSAPRMGRTMRRPQHTFQVSQRPWDIQPFMIAPVLPGETMKNLLLQARVVSDPIKSRMLGCWVEHFFFYVKHRDLDDRDEFVKMMLDPAWTTTAVESATDVPLYYYEGGTASGDYIDWLSKCMKVLVREYFRDENDAPAGVPALHSITGGLYGAKAFGNTWLQSLQPAAAVTWDDVGITVGVDDIITTGEISDAMRRFEWLRSNGAVQMSYEDFLSTYGVNVPKPEELHMPELVRYTRNWEMPVSAITQGTGAATSAWTWNITERADKDRFFKEPGFLVGLSVVRPKVYRSRQLGYAAGMLNNAYAWLPAVLSKDPNTSLKLLPDNNGPLGDFTDSGGAWVDVKDLYLYGDQFVNFTLAATDRGLVALPDTALNSQYAAAADATALFVTPATNYIHQDGIVSLGIAGTLVDTSS